MSGGGGGIVIIKAARAGLSNPLVHGQLPVQMAILVDAVFDKEDGTWTTANKHLVGEAFCWALEHCQ